MVTVSLDDRLDITYEPGDEKAVCITIEYDSEVVADYETGSRPWDEGIIQVRNIIAANVTAYDRDEIQSMLEKRIPAHEPELRSYFGE